MGLHSMKTIQPVLCLQKAHKHYSIPKVHPNELYNHQTNMLLKSRNLEVNV